MGRAVSDSLVDAFLLAHPDVIFVVAAGNEGPGTNTMGQPGSAELALTVGAVYPRALAAIEFNAPNDAMGWWSGRGGALAKPDVVAPGVQYSTVPAWKVGDEIAGGTSMAAPHVAGLAAVLLSASRQESLTVTSAQVVQALRATARPLPGVPHIDQGYGVPDVAAALAWLRARHAALRFRVEAIPPARGGAVARAARVRQPTAAYRRGALAAGDTVQRFRVSLIPDRPADSAMRPAAYRLVSDVPWLRPAQPPAESPDREYPLWLDTGPVLEHWGGGAMTQRVPTLHRSIPRAYVELHRDDAARLGIRGGDRVRIASRRGTLEIEARIDYRAQPPRGHVFVPGFDETHPVNRLTLDTQCPVSGQVGAGACAVRVERLGGASDS